MSYYDILVSANLHRPIKSNQGRHQGKSLGGRRYLGTPSMKSCIDRN